MRTNLLRSALGVVAFGLGATVSPVALGCSQCAEIPASSDALFIESTRVLKLEAIDAYVFEMRTKGPAGSVTPKAAGELDGAPVLGYVFPTTLKPSAVGFGEVEGILALAATSHPDFDDTPLWDENADGDLANDGVVWHTHWVVLQSDERIGALAVKQIAKDDPSVTLPPTNPGMPMYMDSPGFSVITRGNTLRVVVPGYRIRSEPNFRFDAVAAFMRVNTSDMNRPMLGVYKVYSVASGDLSLPYQVEVGGKVE